MARCLLPFAAAAAAFVASPAAAQGGVQVIGASLARSCYLAAESKMSPDVDDFRTCDAALRDGPSAADVVATYVNRGILYLRSGQIEPAVADFDRATALDPGQPEAYLNRGSAFLKRSEAQAALTMFNTALEKRTKRPEIAYYARAVAHEELGNLRAAHGDYLRASQLAPRWDAPRVELTRFRVVNR